MRKLYVGFAFAESMVEDGAVASFSTVSVEEAKNLLQSDYVSACNPSHRATVVALKGRFGIDVRVPEKAPIVALNPGDRILVMKPGGLPRLEGRSEYTEEEVAKATFVFRLIEVL